MRDFLGNELDEPMCAARRGMSIAKAHIDVTRANLHDDGGKRVGVNVLARAGCHAQPRDEGRRVVHELGARDARRWCTGLLVRCPHRRETDDEESNHDSDVDSHAHPLALAR
jgi:hypothetical protein